MCRTTSEWPCHILWCNALYHSANSFSTKELSAAYWRITDDGLTCFLAGRRLYHRRCFPTTDIRSSFCAELLCVVPSQHVDCSTKCKGIRSAECTTLWQIMVTRSIYETFQRVGSLPSLTNERLQTRQRYLVPRSIYCTEGPHQPLTRMC